MGCIALVRCVLVLRCGLAVVVWYPYVGWSLHTDTTPPQPNHNVTPTHIEPNTTHEVTLRISRKLLRMDVLTSETCWALKKVLIKQVASSWSVFTHLILYFQFFFYVSNMSEKILKLRTEIWQFGLQMCWQFVPSEYSSVCSLYSVAIPSPHKTPQPLIQCHYDNRHRM